MPELRYLRNVTTLRLHAQHCSGCGRCAEVCPHRVLAVQDRKAHIRDRDACMECGACARNCPSGAIIVRAGVGCAAALLGNAMGKRGACCCVTEPPAADHP